MSIWCKRIKSYDRTKLKILDSFYAPTWLIIMYLCIGKLLAQMIYLELEIACCVFAVMLRVWVTSFYVSSGDLELLSLHIILFIWKHHQVLVGCYVHRREQELPVLPPEWSKYSLFAANIKASFLNQKFWKFLSLETSVNL